MSSDPKKEIVRGRTTATKRLESSAKEAPTSTPSSGTAVEEGTQLEKPNEAAPTAPGSDPDSTNATQPPAGHAASTSHPYPWTYMTSTLEAAFNENPSPEQTQTTSGPTVSSQTQTKYTYHFKDAKHTELGPLYDAGGAEDETDTVQPSSAQVQQGGIHPATGSTADSTDSAIAQKASAIIRTFLSHGEACSVAESEALKLATTPISFSSPSNRQDSGSSEEARDSQSKPEKARTKTQNAMVNSVPLDSDSDSEDDGIFKRRNDVYDDDEQVEDTTATTADEFVQTEEPDLEDELEDKLQAYRNMLDRLEKLHDEAVQLQSSILELIEAPGERGDPQMERESLTSGHDQGEPAPIPANHSPPPSASTSTSTATTTNTTTTSDEDQTTPELQILGIVKASLPVLKARISNLEMAIELVDSAQENLTISYRMESLGL
ncbi:hypothetical protein AX16_007791 [Volvariella volvacea WC 439]|nr:hypothetical protein AX16_007791 [Volvariella volvacea WC 439]